MKRVLEWLILSLVGLGALTLVSPHVPASIRKLVLFPIAIALVAAAILSALARFSHVVPTRAIFLLTGMLIFGTEVAGTVLHWQLNVATRKVVEHDPGAAMARSMIESAAPDDDPAARANYERVLAELQASDERYLEKQRRERSFSAYLATRLTQVGDWPPPWPWVFWMAEILVATLVGLWLFGQTTNPPQPTEIPPIDPPQGDESRR